MDWSQVACSLGMQTQTWQSTSVFGVILQPHQFIAMHEIKSKTHISVAELIKTQTNQETCPGSSRASMYWDFMNFTFTQDHVVHWKFMWKTTSFASFIYKAFQDRGHAHNDHTATHNERSPKLQVTFFWILLQALDLTRVFRIWVLKDLCNVRLCWLRLSVPSHFIFKSSF